MANKKINPQETKTFIDILYMTPSEIRAKDIAELLQNVEGVKVELWNEMNVLEIGLANDNSVDMEPLDIDFKDPSDISFIRNREIKTIFALTLNDDDLDAVETLFEKIVDKYSGFLCADTADFYPVYVGTTKK
ncbi:MAG: hypothetical protein WBI07_16905 [Mobilitalea sp.]